MKSLLPARAAAAAALVSGALALAAACGPAGMGRDGVPRWPDRLPPAAATMAPRGYAPARASIHLHSVWSHDACDRAPADSTGRPNEPCLARLRRALCLQRIDAAFMTEHDRRLAEADSLHDALLFREDDRRIEAGGRLVAKRQTCPDGRSVVWLPGAENALMPVALDSLPPGTPEERSAFFNADTAGAAALFRALGGMVLLSHSEDMTPERVAGLDVDGLEVVNPHAIFAPKHRESLGLSRLGAYVALLPFYTRQTRAHPDLALLAVFQPNPLALDRWDMMLARRAAVGVGANDAHENALPWTLSDGERGDAYERMVAWVTNVLLVDGDAGDPGALEDALRRGRSYVAIEAWGTPVGFDFRLEGPAAPEGAEGASLVEMGETIAFAPGQEIVVQVPRVVLGTLDPASEPRLPEPLIHTRVVRIEESGRRTIVAQTAAEQTTRAVEPLTFPVPGPGAYRVEVSLVPRHLEPYLGGAALMREVPWIYANAIRVIPQ